MDSELSRCVFNQWKHIWYKISILPTIDRALRITEFPIFFIVDCDVEVSAIFTFVKFQGKKQTPDLYILAVRTPSIADTEISIIFLSGHSEATFIKFDIGYF